MAFLDETGLAHFWQQILGRLNNFVRAEEGKGLSTNDLTDTLKSNYDAAYNYSISAHAPKDAEKNVIVGIQKNGTNLSVDSNRRVNITVPTSASDVGAVPTSRKINGKALSTNITLSASEVGALPANTHIPSTVAEMSDAGNYALKSDKVSKSGDTMTGALTTKGIKLTSGTDYGDTLPSSPATNQLFFQTVGSNFVLDNVYPVGSIYMNVNSTNPGTLFGGTWEQIQGKFLLGMSSEYPAGSQGGEATHTLTTSEIPFHAHDIGQDGNTSMTLPTQYAVGDSSQSRYVTTLEGGASGYYKSSVAWGGALITRGQTSPYGQAHNNMPPYLSVYIWKRTA